MQTNDKPVPGRKSERYRETAAVLARHGIGVLGSHRAEHVRRACEELGTTFIKLGQLLSTRADLLPEEYRVELAKLQDNVEPIPFEQIEEVIVNELGASPELIFSWFDREPLGSASIAQVHAARTTDGRAVVVKVQKPGVRETVEADLEILGGLLHEWRERFPVLEEYDAERLFQDFADSLRAELDYTREAANLERFREMFRDDPSIELPQSFEQWSTASVLTLSRIEGAKPAELPPAVRGREPLARAIARFVVDPAFEIGMFHADPHGGNMLVTREGALAVLDFGMVAHLSSDDRRKLADLLLAIDRGDAPRLADRLLDIASPARPADRSALTSDLRRLLQRYADEEAGSVNFGEALGALFDVVREYRLRLPGNFAQLFKALVMAEGLIRVLDPQATLSGYLKPAVKKAMLRRYAGDDWAMRAQTTAADAADLALELPRRIDRVLAEVERGNLRVWTRLDDVETLVTRLERAAERTNATLLAAACIVAIAIVMLFYHPRGWVTWIPVVFWIAVAAAIVHVVRTLIALRR